EKATDTKQPSLAFHFFATAPVATSTMRSDPSVSPDASFLPSADSARHRDKLGSSELIVLFVLSSPTRRSSLPVFGSQKRMVWSKLLEYSTLPSGEKASPSATPPMTYAILDLLPLDRIPNLHPGSDG